MSIKGAICVKHGVCRSMVRIYLFRAQFVDEEYASMIILLVLVFTKWRCAAVSRAGKRVHFLIFLWNHYLAVAKLYVNYTDFYGDLWQVHLVGSQTCFMDSQTTRKTINAPDPWHEPQMMMAVPPFSRLDPHVAPLYPWFPLFNTLSAAAARVESKNSALTLNTWLNLKKSEKSQNDRSLNT